MEKMMIINKDVAKSFRNPIFIQMLNVSHHIREAEDYFD